MTLKIKQQVKIILCMSQLFIKQWTLYISLWWNKFCPIYFDDLFPVSSILLWGATSYEEYKTSKYYLFHNSIQLNSYHQSDLFPNIYYLMRKVDQDKDFLFFFANTTDFKNLIFSQVSFENENKSTHHQTNIDWIKRLYQQNINMYQLFHHDYSENCWDALLEKF